LAARASKRAATGPTFGDVVDVVRDYLSEIVIPIPALPNVGRRAAFLGLAGSALALLLSEAFFVGPLGRVMLALPFLGVALSAAAAWFATPQVAAELTSVREAELRAELEVLSDSRVALVIRQFEWAVNDVEKMRQAVRRADAAKAAADKKSAELELRVRQFREMVARAQTQLAAYAAEPLKVPEATWTPEPSRTIALRWGLHDDGAMTWLRLEGDDMETTRVRLLDGQDCVVTLSDPARPASPRSDGPVGVALEMSVPPAIIADIAEGSLAPHRFEALVGEEWRAVTLSHGGLRTGSTKDKRSHFYVTEAVRSA
jgi:hypothetical protein